MSLKHRTYFDGSVQSLELFTQEGRATVGVLEPGRYRFSTDEEEHIRVVAGAMRVRLAGSSEWRVYRDGEVCVVGSNSEFDVETDAHAAYLCLYVASQRGRDGAEAGAAKAAPAPDITAT